MKSRVAGIILGIILALMLVIALLIFIGGLIHAFFNNKLDIEFGSIVALIIILLTPPSFYLYWTKFGKRDDLELIKLQKENQILKIKIEQIELKRKLNEKS